MTLKDDVLKVLGFTYGNPDVSPICPVQLRDEVLAVVEKHIGEVEGFCEWLESGWDITYVKPEYVEKKKELLDKE